jgi:hypothetical protein
MALKSGGSGCIYICKNQLTLILQKVKLIKNLKEN